MIVIQQTPIHQISMRRSANEGMISLFAFDFDRDGLNGDTAKQSADIRHKPQDTGNQIGAKFTEKQTAGV